MNVRRVGIMAIATMLLVSIFGWQLLTHDDKNPPQPDLPTPEDKITYKNSNMGSLLNQIVEEYEQGGSSPEAAQKAAKKLPLHQNGSVAVTFYTSGEEHIEPLTIFLKDNEVLPRNIGEDYIEAYVPVPLLKAASEQPGVIRIRAIFPPTADIVA